MGVDVRPVNGTRACVFEVSGDVDIAAVPQLKTKLDFTLETGYRNVILDLSRVAYADSSALSLLIWLDRRLAPLGGRLVLAGANRDITRVLELSGLVEVAASVETSPNVAAALEGLRLPDTSVQPLWTRTIEVAARPEALSGVREEACESIADLHVSESSLFDMKVALGEALANAVRHGSPGGAEDTITVVIEGYEDRVVLRVTDAGVGFDGVQADTDDIYASGGRGIQFMRALMDRVEFECLPAGGTSVILTKHRTEASAL